MKVSLITLLLVLAIAITSCTSQEEILPVNITGKAQKGPLLNGSVVTLSEIDKNLNQTGKVFTTNISSDNGNFELNQVLLENHFALLTANGFYFNEVYGKLSPSQITLQAYVDLKDKEKINVNILTHLTKPRIEKLVSDGMTIGAAKQKAETEFLTFFGQNSSLDAEFEDLDITQASEANAILLAFSVISQRYSQIYGHEATSTAELSELLIRIANDFKDNGEINSQPIIDTLMHNIKMTTMDDVRQKVETRFLTEGSTASIPNFEKYVSLFQKKHSSKIYSTFEYPAIAAANQIMNPESTLPNLLAQSGTCNRQPYSLAAIVPFDQKLTIKIKYNPGTTIMTGGPMLGWKYIRDSGTNTITFESQRNNMLISALIYLEEKGSATIEFYEGNMENPSKVNTIAW